MFCFLKTEEEFEASSTIVWSRAPNNRKHARHLTSNQAHPRYERLLGDQCGYGLGHLKISSQLIGHFKGKAFLPRIHIHIARYVAKLSRVRMKFKFSFDQPSCNMFQVATRSANKLTRLLQIFKSSSLRRLKRRSDSMAKAFKVSPSVLRRKSLQAAVQTRENLKCALCSHCCGPLLSEVWNSKSKVSTNHHACAVTSTTNK